MTMNKILLVLIVASGFLLIFYANNDILTRKKLFSFFQSDYEHNSASNHHETNFTDIRRVKYIPKNTTEYNIFVIYTRETFVLKTKFELFLKSLLKYTTIPFNLHIVTDERSELSVEDILKKEINEYRRVVFYTLYNMEDSAAKISDISKAMMPHFNSNPGSYYSDALFYLSLGLHRIVDPNMSKAILIDCDVVFRSDVKRLFDEFDRFSTENLFGLAPELTPVYRHILYKYRRLNPNTNFGNPYYPNTKSKRRKRKHGYPGLNSGVVLLNFDKIRNSKLFQENLKAENVNRIARKYYFKGHLGDQDYYTLLGYEFPSLIYRLDCIWNRQLCTWWKTHGYSEIFDTFFHCEVCSQCMISILIHGMTLKNDILNDSLTNESKDLYENGFEQKPGFRWTQNRTIKKFIFLDLYKHWNIVIPSSGNCC